MKLLDRQDVFKQYKILASHIHGIQQSFYDEDEEESYTSKFDAISLTVKDYNTHNFCARVASDQKALHPLEISGKLKALFTEIDCEALILIPFIKLDFFSSKILPTPILLKLIRIWQHIFLQKPILKLLKFLLQI